jgi:hypothetical protein
MKNVDPKERIYPLCIEILGSEEYENKYENGKIWVNQKWQPIETAPSDKEVLVLFEKKQYVAYKTMHYRRGQEWLIPCMCEYAEDRQIFEPTHWMPLPAEPDETT